VTEGPGRDVDGRADAPGGPPVRSGRSHPAPPAPARAPAPPRVVSPPPVPAGPEWVPPPGWAPPGGWAPPPPGWLPPAPSEDPAGNAWGWQGPLDPDTRQPLAPGTPGAGTGTADVSLGVQLAAGAAPVNRGAAGMWVLFGLLGFVGGQILATIFILVGAAITGNVHSITAISKLSEPPTWYIISTLLGLWAGFLGGPWIASLARGTGSFVRDVGLRFRWVDGVGIAIGAGGQLLVGLIYIPISHHVHDFNQKFDAPAQKLTGGSHGVGFAVIAVFTVVGAPFFEELFFRGLLLRALARLFGTWGRWVGPTLAIVISGVLFGLAHAESLQLIGLATFGIILSLVSYRTGRLGMNMVSHASFNLVAVIATVWSGGGVVVVTLAMVVVGLGALMVGRSRRGARI
jgi:uncharacterized protein